MKNWNILIIGNGYDLALGLKTNYIDILGYLKEKNLIQNNIWVEYLSQKYDFDKGVGVNWIDIEKEIAYICIEFDKMEFVSGVYNNNNKNGFDPDAKYIFTFWELVVKKENKYNKIYVFENIFMEFISFMHSELKELIDELNIYFLKVNQENINLEFPQLLKAGITHVICFNYTSTIERVSSDINKENIHYIHGRASEDKCNLVFGINEYLDSNKKMTNIRFIKFKKYYQRIYHKTGNKYKKWFQEMKNNKEKANIYVLGHSLDVTDKDILFDIIMNENVGKTIIFYHEDENGEAHSQKIANLATIIGPDVLIEKTGNEKIEFRKQDNPRKKTNLYDPEKN